MKGQLNQRGGMAANRAGVVSRFFFVSACLGLLIGLFEATLLWTTPRVIPLLVPDVGWVIWFLAPLVDMGFFALAGLCLGLLARQTRGRKEIFAALEGGLAITFVFLMLQWFHGGFAITPLNFATDVGMPLIALVIFFAILLMVFAATWNRLSAFTENWLGRAMMPLGWVLATAFIVLMVGIGVFVLWPPITSPAAGPTVPPPSGTPNIVFITLDTVRADHLSSYGYSRPTTPNIDRFAHTGVLFENAIAPSSWTLTSHASMFTGLLPQQHGAESFVPMASGPHTLAEILRLQEYRTAGVIGNPTYLERGWDVAQGFETYDDSTLSLRHNLSQTLLGTAVVQPLYQILWEFGLSHLNLWFDRRNARDLNGAALDWARRRQQRPYFLFINYIDAHDPYATPEPSQGRFGRIPASVAQKLDVGLHRGYGSSFSAKDRALMIDGYDSCLAYLDKHVGELLTQLSRLPGWHNTIVIITSDHGEEFGGHGEYIHGLSLYRALLHVPLIIAGPGIPKGLRVSHIVGTRQLFSTVLDLAGRGKTPFSRTSLARFWEPKYEPTQSDGAVVSEDIPVYGRDAWHPMVSLTSSDWHYIEHQDGRQELYNWTADPGEQENLAAAPGEQATLEKLRSRLISLVSDATGPWHGTDYLRALDSVSGPARLSLFRPQPFQPDAVGNKFRIGNAQAFFEPDETTPTRPSQSERELMQSLPYQ